MLLLARSVQVTEKLGLGEGDGDGDGDTLGDGLGDGERLGLGDGECLEVVVDGGLSPPSFSPEHFPF